MPEVNKTQFKGLMCKEELLSLATVERMDFIIKEELSKIDSSVRGAIKSCEQLLSKKYNVSQDTITKIRLKVTWRD